MGGIRSTKNCFYCGKSCNTRDHVPSKLLLRRPYPNNLLTIPACGECNKSFSKDEEYFLNVLVEITSNPELISRKRPGGSVFRAREQSPGLKKLIENSLEKGKDGRIYFQSHTSRIKRVIEKIAFGLYYHRYKRRSNPDLFNCFGFYPYNVEEMRPAEVYMLTYSEKFRLKKWTHIQMDAFSYIVVRDWRRNNRLTMIFHIQNTVWCLISIPLPRGLHGKFKPSINQLKLFKKA